MERERAIGFERTRLERLMHSNLQGTLLEASPEVTFSVGF